MRQPKNSPQSYDDMLQEQTEGRNKKTKFYKAQSDENRRTELSILTGRIGKELSTAATKAKKLQLVGGDLEQVQKQTLLYFEACETAGTLPSFIGLCRALGYSRTGVYNVLERHPDAPVSQWLEMVRDAVSDALDAAAMANQINVIAALFIQKSIHGRRETFEIIAAKTDSPLGEARSVEAAQQYARQLEAGLPED